jgi:GDP-L-fucose synthase
MTFYKNKSVLVTGGTGMIGQALCKLLLDNGADVTVASLDNPERAPSDVKFKQADLRSFDNCMEVAAGHEIVFHLAGVKGSPKMTAERPASFFVPTLQFSLNMMEAARRMGVKHYLFTSSVGVYQPANIFNEDDVWSTFPSPNDRFAGWAKRMCELQAEAYQIEYKWEHVSIVRPANVYGPFDNFDPENAMVIPSLIHRALNEDGPLVVWGDGSAIRDFIFSEDVAKGMMICLEKNINQPINLGSGGGVSIKEVAETIAQLTGKEVIWDISKPSGDRLRIMDTGRAKEFGIASEVSLRDGILQTLDWYKKNQIFAQKRYNAFTETELLPNHIE